MPIHKSKLWNIAKILGFLTAVSGASACNQASNDIDLEVFRCGNKANSEDRLAQLTYENRPMMLEPEAYAFLADKSRVPLEYTEKSCLSIPRGTETVTVLDKLGSKAAKLHSKEVDQILGQEFPQIQLIPYTSIDSLMFRETELFSSLCAKDGKLFLNTKEDEIAIKFPLGFANNGIKARVISNGTVHQELNVVTDGDGLFKFKTDFSSLPINQFNIQIEDIFGNQLNSHSCNLTYNFSKPIFTKVSEKTYYEGMYFESEGIKDFAVSMISKVPLDSVSVSFSKRDSQTIVMDLPAYSFNNDDNWRVQLPIPDGRGEWLLSIKAQDRAGNEATASVNLDLGQKYQFKETLASVDLVGPKQDQIFTALESGRASLVDRNTGTETFQVAVQGPIRKGVISDDGLQLAIANPRTVFAYDRQQNSEATYEHKQEINYLGLHRPSSTVATASGDQTVKLFNLSQLALDSEYNFTSQPLSTFLTEDGSTVVTALSMGQVIIQDRNGDIQERDFSPCSQSRSSKITIDQKFLVVGCLESLQKGLLSIYTYPGLKLHYQQEFKGWVTKVAVSNDSRFAAAINNMGQWALVNIETLATYPRNELDAIKFKLFHKGFGKGVKFSEDSRFLLSYGEDGKAQVIDVQTKSVVETFQHDSEIVDANFTEDSKNVIVGSKNGNVEIRALPSLSFSTQTPQALESSHLSSNSKLMAVSTSGTKNLVEVIELASGKTIDTVTLPNKASKIAFTPGDVSLLIRTDEAVYIRDFVVGRDWKIGGSKEDEIKKIYGINFSHQTSEVVLAAGSKAYIFPLVEGSDPRLIISTENWIEEAGYSQDDKFIITSDANFSATVWDSVTGKQVVQQKFQAIVGDAQLSSDNKIFIAGDWSGKLTISRVLADEQQMRLETLKTIQFAGGVDFIRISPDDRYAVASSWDSSFLIIDLLDLTIKKINCSEGRYLSDFLYFSDSRKIFALSANNRGLIFDLSSGKLLQSMNHFEPLKSIALSRDDGLLLTASSDGDIRINEFIPGRKSFCSPFPK